MKRLYKFHKISITILSLAQNSNYVQEIHNINKNNGDPYKVF